MYWFSYLMDKQLKHMYKVYGGVKKSASHIEITALSLHVLLNNLLDPKKRSKRQIISTLRGPILNPTRTKLRGLEKSFTELGNNLREFYTFFNQFRARSIKGEYSIIYQNSKSWWEYWEGNGHKIDILIKRIVLKLSVPRGEFYITTTEGRDIRSADVTNLKKDVNALLVLIRNKFE